MLNNFFFHSDSSSVIDRMKDCAGASARQRPLFLYSHDIEKYVNLKNIYMYISYVYCIYLYVYSLRMCTIFYITPIGSLNTLDTARYPVPGSPFVSNDQGKER